MDVALLELLGIDQNPGEDGRIQLALLIKSEASSPHSSVCFSIMRSNDPQQRRFIPMHYLEVPLILWGTPWRHPQHPG